jgi:hypothetical protein
MTKPNIFNWRPAGEKAALIPVEDGAEIVAMTVTTFCGGYSRPIDIAPDVYLARWDVRCIEVPLLRTVLGGACVNRDVRFWTTPAEYRAAVESLSEYRAAPRFVQGIICCPFVFVRPVDRRPEVSLFYAADDMAAHRCCYEARVVWADGNTGAAPERWSSAHLSGPDRHMSPGYLDRGGFGASEQPFRWCHLVEFFPPQVFTDLRAEAERRREYELNKIAAYEALANVTEAT